MNTKSETLLAYKDVMKLTQVSRKTIWKWQAEGKFPKSRDVNGMVRWRSADVEAWVQGLA